MPFGCLPQKQSVKCVDCSCVDYQLLISKVLFNSRLVCDWVQLLIRIELSCTWHSSCPSMLIPVSVASKLGVALPPSINFAFADSDATLLSSAVIPANRLGNIEYC